MQDMSAFQEVKIAIYCNYKLHSVPERSECNRNSFLMAIVTLPRQTCCVDAFVDPRVAAVYWFHDISLY